MIIKHLQYTTIILWMFLSCQTQEESDLKSCLQQAGDNRYELEHVIFHYEQDSDSSKLEAAKYLIRNM